MQKMRDGFNSRSAQGQELDMATLETSFELILCGDEIVCSVGKSNLADCDLFIL